MKKLIIILLTVHFSLFTLHSLSQPCLPEGISFTTQAQIDNFQTNYPGCTEIEGGVTIEGGDITNLDGLSVLTSIGGTLQITSNTVLASIASLQNLTYIGEDIIIGSQFQPAMPPPMGGNPLLSNLEGLNGITSIGGMIYFRANSGLTSFSGLGNLITIGGSLIVANNDSLSSFEGLENLTAIGGSLGIFANELLVSLSGLDNLSGITGHLAIGSNSHMGEDGGNPSLTSLTGLENITSIEGEFSIKNNETLTTLLNLQSIEAGSIDSITIIDNSALSECQVSAICDYLESPDPVVEIFDNATGCNSQEEVEEACWTSVDEMNLDNQFTISPNPLESTTIIKYNLNYKSSVTIEIFDLTGHKIITLVDYIQQQGEQQQVFNSSSLSAGIYFCVLKTNGGTQTKKMIKL